MEDTPVAAKKTIFGNETAFTFAWCALISVGLFYLIFSGSELVAVTMLVVPFILLWILVKIASKPFYGILIFLFMRHLFPIGLLGLIRNTTFQQLIYLAVLELTLASVFVYNARARVLGAKIISTSFPWTYLLVVGLMFASVVISSMPRIIDYQNFFSLKVMTGMDHVNREVYVFFLNGLLLSALMVMLVDGKEKVRVLMWAMVVIGLVLAAEGFLQYTGLLVVTENQRFFFVNEGRLTALTGYSAGVTGERMLIPLLFALSLLMLEKGRKALFLFASASVLFLAILLTYTRAVYFALMLSLLIYFLLSVKSADFKRRLKKLAPALLVPLFSMMVAVYYLGFIEHFQTTGRLGGKLTMFGGHSLLVRVMRWNLVQEAVREHMLNGYGLGASKEVLGMYAVGVFAHLYSSIHNFYLSWVVDTGLMGGAALLTLFAVTGRNLLRARRLAAAGKDSTVFVYSNILFAAFFGGSLMYVVNSDYAFDIFYFFMLALSFALLRLASGRGAIPTRRMVLTTTEGSG